MPVKVIPKAKSIDTNTLIPFDASIGILPTGGKKGQGYHVIIAGMISGVKFLAKDIFYALKDNPTNINDFGDIQSETQYDDNTDFELQFLISLL
ncbi:hypothetical protein LV89_01845 [Arcicella aurantiaca]|uniref:Uncharacterized protein n=1 Tax=Arcicella aurantiaca TaxID=591202 RepID=A0A316E8E8_9BACT|nr:hypothetical protein [Arcicella aurantiaca]PWK27033.1 hypothetical protein LV89_01845 [Arcicella aurantiaca]